MCVFAPRVSPGDRGVRLEGLSPTGTRPAQQAQDRRRALGRSAPRGREWSAMRRLEELSPQVSGPLSAHVFLREAPSMRPLRESDSSSGRPRLRVESARRIAVRNFRARRELSPPRFRERHFGAVGACRRVGRKRVAESSLGLKRLGMAVNQDVVREASADERRLPLGVRETSRRTDWRHATSTPNRR